MSKKRFIIVLVSSCAVAGALTFIFLSAVGLAARTRAENRYTEPDYIRYAAQGYSFDTVSNKTSLLVTVTHEDTPVRISLLTMDEDKLTLDILDIPPKLYTVVDGFSGTLERAYETSVYKQIVSKSLELRIDHEIVMSADSFATAVDLLGGTTACIDRAIKIGKTQIQKGKVCFDYDLTLAIMLDENAYDRADDVYIYHALISSVIGKTNNIGTVQSVSKLMSLLLNSATTDMKAQDMITVANISSKLRLRKMNIHLLPGEICEHENERVYSIHLQNAVSLLDQSFRVHGVSISSLSSPELINNSDWYSDLPKQINEYIN